MLRTLRVNNFALIKEAEIEFASGLNLITGETGAGKSLLLGALSALLGEKIPSELLRSRSEKVIIEGEFIVENDKRVTKFFEEVEEPPAYNIILRREIHPTGRTRNFFNDTPISLKLLNGLSGLLVELCGQHEHQSLFKVENHLEYLDKFAGLEQKRVDFETVYQRYRKFAEKLHKLKEKQKQLSSRWERLEFEIREITSCNVSLGEEEQLSKEEKVLQNSEHILQFCYNAEREISTKSGAILESLSSMLKETEAFSDYAPEFKGVSEDIISSQASLEEAVRLIVGFRSKFNFNPGRLEAIRERLGEISLLKRKYGGSVESTLKRLDDLKREKASFENLEAQIAETEKDLASAHSEMSNKSIDLSHLRARAIPQLKKSLEKTLTELGFNYVEFELRMQKRLGDDVDFEGKCYQVQATGIDFAEIFISTNKGEAVQLLREIASGGEISRIMLGLKSVIAEREEFGTLIFDEIDNGISGRIARKVGLKLYQTGKTRQVIVVTHLPQIASLPGRHFSVTKTEAGGKSVSRFWELQEEERVSEIAKLLSAGQSRDQGLDYAKELLEAKDITGI
jgi:DNA repair protein RecN (Recombination protein N)